MAPSQRQLQARAKHQAAAWQLLPSTAPADLPADVVWPKAAHEISTSVAQALRPFIDATKLGAWDKAVAAMAKLPAPPPAPSTAPPGTVNAAQTPLATSALQFAGSPLASAALAAGLSPQLTGGPHVDLLGRARP